jgi:hypothetical protein
LLIVSCMLLLLERGVIGVGLLVKGRRFQTHQEVNSRVLWFDVDHWACCMYNINLTDD